jgi:hemerythrin-like domain-containing protein
VATDDQVLIDTRDMNAVHGAFRRAFGDAPGQITSVTDGDRQRARQLADYLGEVLWLLHAHHAGEDELLYPLLAERAPEHQDLFSRMDAQHSGMLSNIEETGQATERFGASGAKADGQAAAGAYETLLVVTDKHLGEEEEEVLPIAARVITPPEWGALPAHAIQHYSGQRLWLAFGLVLEAMPDDIRENMLSQIPPPVSGMWFGGGADSFAKEMAMVRGGAA